MTDEESSKREPVGGLNGAVLAAGAMMQLAGSLDAHALTEAADISNPVLDSAITLVDNANEAVAEGNNGAREGEDAASAEQIAESEEGEYSEGDGSSDAWEFNDNDQWGDDDHDDSDVAGDNDRSWF